MLVHIQVVDWLQVDKFDQFRAVCNDSVIVIVNSVSLTLWRSQPILYWSKLIIFIDPVVVTTNYVMVLIDSLY